MQIPEKLFSNDKIVVISHNDLDGIGPNLLCAFYKKFMKCSYDFEIINCSYDNVNEIVMKTLRRDDFNDSAISKVKYFVISDLSVSAETAEEIDKLNKAGIVKPYLFDHHVDRNGISKYDWCVIQLEQPKAKWYSDVPDLKSGTKFFYEFLVHILNLEEDKTFAEALVDMITYYDTWYWKTVLGENENPEYNSIDVQIAKCAKKLNSLYYLYGKEDFIEAILAIVEKSDEKGLGDFIGELMNFLIQFDPIERTTNKKTEYYASNEEEIIRLNVKVPNIGEVRVGCIFYEDDISNMGNLIAEKYPDIDIAAVIQINTNKISYRSVKKTPQADCGALASFLGGGGKFHTAGSQIIPELKHVFAAMIIEKSISI